MKGFTKLTMFASFAMMALMSVNSLLAQPAQPPQDGNRGGGRGDRRMNMQDMTDEQRQQMMERFEARRKEMIKQQNEQLRESLGMTEDEFAAIEPMISKVRQLSGEYAFAGRGFGGFGGRGNRGPRGGFNPFGSGDASPQAKAVTDAADALRETLDKEDATADQIKDNLAAYRKARVALQDALRQAREELRGYLTTKQEAQLVMDGLLD